jgi:hypothetical protein
LKFQDWKVKRGFSDLRTSPFSRDEIPKAIDNKLEQFEFFQYIVAKYQTSGHSLTA